MFMGFSLAKLLQRSITHIKWGNKRGRMSPFRLRKNLIIDFEYAEMLFCINNIHQPTWLVPQKQKV